MTSTEEPKVTPSQADNSATTQQEHACVLLVEDDPALRRYLEIFLQRARYQVICANDGLEAMKVLLSRPVDIVVTDALMPNLNGYELSRFVRSSPHLSTLPIVLLSALDPRNAEAEHVDAFLEKPVDHDELLNCLSRFTKREG
jgi:DNA-binding response OmpR family regulator